MMIKNGFINLATADGEMEVYFAGPDKVKVAAIIIFHEAFGVNDHIKDVCHRFAEHGYFVVAPELYHRHGTHLEFPYSGRSDAMTYLKELTHENLNTDIQAVMDMLHEIPSVDSTRIATVGFCVGGYISVFAAARFSLAGSIAFYGAGMLHERPGFGLKPLKDQFKDINSPLLLFFGQNDSSIPIDEVHQLQNILEQEGKAFRSVIFENSSHGFFCDQRKSYNKLAAQDAWDMCLEFLREIFNPESYSTPGNFAASMEGVAEFKSISGEADSPL